MKIIKEIKDFSTKGSFIDMAVGIVIGGAFSTVVKSLVEDIINPVIGLITNGVDLTDVFIILKHGATKGLKYITLDQANADGAVTLNIGQLCNNIISFIIIAVVLFFVIKAINKTKEALETPQSPSMPTTKSCPFCFSSINIKAVKCPNCTSQLPE